MLPPVFESLKANILPKSFFKVEDEEIKKEVVSRYPYRKWIKKNIQNFDCKIINSSADIGLISVQGPESLNLINDAFSKNFSNLKKFSFNNILVSNKLKT